MCGAPLGSGPHTHVVDLDERGVRCACRACALLFVQQGAARGRYRTVPDRVLADPGFSLGEAQWAELGVPVHLAFFFRNSRLGQWIAMYPSPAGATEAPLPQDAWARLAGASALAAEIQPDVEALLVYAPRGRTALESFLAPIDTCYELVARIRTTWRGFDGGEESRRSIEAFFQSLRQRARPLRRAPGTGG